MQPEGPAFAVDPETGVPSWEDCQKYAWSSYQFTEAGSTSYQNLYQNAHGLADSFGQFWQHAAAYFEGNTNVIGFGKGVVCMCCRVYCWHPRKSSGCHIDCNM